MEAVVERLNALDAAGAIDDVDVHVTGRKICPESVTATTDPGKFCDRIASFEAWADRTGRSIASAFRRLEDERGIDGCDHSGIVFPTMAMAEYDDQGLRFVSPVTEGPIVHTVQDRLDVLKWRVKTATDHGTREVVE